MGKESAAANMCFGRGDLRLGKESAAANTLAVLARRLTPHRRKYIKPKLKCIVTQVTGKAGEECVSGEEICVWARN